MKIFSTNTTYSNISVLNQCNSLRAYRKDIPNFSDQISFGIANAGALKKMFTYGLPCIYTGYEMIDSKKFQRIIKRGGFSGDAKTSLKYLSQFKNSFHDNEKFLYTLFKLYPNKNDKSISDILQKISPAFEKKLIFTQKLILNKIRQLSFDAPENVQKKIQELIEINIKKINKEPVVIPFKKKEFMYKLNKIFKDINKMQNVKASKVMIKLIKEGEKLFVYNNQDIQSQKEILNFMNIILKTSVLRDNIQLKSLFETSIARLENKPVYLDFSRKAFIYDLASMTDKIPDKKFKEKIFKTSTKLPKSSNSVSAYIIKLSKETPEKVAYRLCWPYFASIEHLYPKSLGGQNKMSNFAGACTKANSERQSIDFMTQLALHPKIPQYCQKYIDRLLLYKKNGILKDVKMDPLYIYDFADTIYHLSNGKIKLKIKE